MEQQRGVAIVTDAWDASGGGCEQYVGEVARALGARGWGVDVFVRRAVVESGLSPGVTVHRLGREGLAWRPATAIAAYRRAHPDRPVLATWAWPHATHCQLHSGLYVDAFTAERSSFDSTLRRACFWPALAFNLRRRRLLRDERLTLSPTGANAVMAFSAATHAAVSRHFGASAARVTALAPGIDRRRFHPHGRAAQSGGTLQLLFAGHNFRLKGLTQALATLAAVRARGLDARLVIAGHGSPRLAHDTARRLGIPSAIECIGAVSPDAMPSRYRAAHVLLHPTFYDPFSRVVLEAWACGCPVVTTSHCGAADLMTAGREGFAVSDPRDVSGLADAVVASADTGRWRMMSEAAARLGAGFDLDRHVESLVEWLT